MPSDRGYDSTLALLVEGYTFISKRCARYDTDVFATRLRLEPTICMRGQEAASVFYDTDRFTRVEAAPDRLSKTLFGEGGVQALDGAAHRSRKAMFMDLMSPSRIDDLVADTDRHWRHALERWAGQDRVVLFDEVTEVLSRSVCSWAGVPLEESEIGTRTGDLAAMIDAAGSVGPRYLRGRWARMRSNRWAEQLIRGQRRGLIVAPPETALAHIAAHRQPDGTLLDDHSAAVDLLNVLRPTVAVARYIVFLAMALHRRPAVRTRLQEHPDDDRYVGWVVQEVRRAYPFFPFVAARVQQEFMWRGHKFPEGARVLLDLYGTDHDERSWPEPDRFIPERFAEWDGSAYDLIPQGGGDHHTNHRCAGEWITIALMRHALRFLTQAMEYEVPAQDLSLRLSRLPAIPSSRFLMTAVHPV